VASVQGADEVLVVEDGGSDDAAHRGLEDATVILLPRVGRSAARNAGVEAASGDYVAFLDADDVSLPDRIPRQRDALDANPEAVLCFGAVRVVDDRLDPIERWRTILEPRYEQLVEGGADYEAILASHCPIYTSATMVRRAPFLDSGGYDRRIDAYEDLDLYLRLARHGPLVPAPGGPVTLYRVHGQNTDSDRLFAGSLAVAQKHLDDGVEGQARRLLIERRLDALWGLGRFGQVRRASAKAVLRDPLIVTDPRFLKRAAGSLLPTPLLRARRR
jgi:glycosyltransferase involved in cell wall biosynthesis